MTHSLKYLLLIAVFAVSLLNACNNSPLSSTSLGAALSTDSLSFAELFQINRYKDFTEISVKSNSNNTIQKYFLIDRNQKVPKILKNEHVIFTPVRKIVCLSTTHIAFIDLLNENHSIIGVSGKDYVFNTKIRQGFETDSITDVGYENNLNLEFLIRKKPDVVFVYDIDGGVSESVNKLKSIGIQVVQVNEYRESNILGVTEWLKFFACFYQKSDTAKTKFDEIASNYIKLKDLTKDIKKRPSVLVNLPWKGVWYIAGGRTNVAQLIADAGGNYIRRNDESEENPAVPFETIYKIGESAEFWINTGQAKSKSEILAADDRLINFRSMKKDRVYNRNARLNEFGGNDYMESGTVRPDLILKDLISIFHPELLPKHQLFYYQHLE